MELADGEGGALWATFCASSLKVRERTPPIVLVLLPAWLQINLVNLVEEIKPIPMAVAILLVLASLLSWTIVLSKWSSFGKARRLNRLFLRVFRKATNLQAVAAAQRAVHPRAAGCGLRFRLW